MEKRKERHGISRILALTLSFLMIFTGLGIGQWGLEDAWADGFSIVIQPDGVSVSEGIEKTSVTCDVTIAGNRIIGTNVRKDNLTTYLLTVPVAADAVYISNNVKYTNSSGNEAVAFTLYHQCGIVASASPAVSSTEKTVSSYNKYLASSRSAVTSTGFTSESLSTDEIASFYYFYFNFGSAGDLGNYAVTDGEDFAVLIQCIPVEEVDKANLEQALSTAKSVTGYHTENDRWNGKEYLEMGFWAQLQAYISDAQDVCDKEDATQTETDNATAVLTTGLQEITPKLIPTTQVNATALYEALEATKSIYNLTDGASAYSEATWNAFTESYKDAEKLLNSLFYQESDEKPDGKAVGDATEINIAANQNKVDAAAEDLTTAYDELLSVKSEAQLPLLKKAGNWLLSQTGLSSSDYTPESWSAWYDETDIDKNGVGDGAYQILEATNPDIVTNIEYSEYTKAVNSASNAYNALTDAKDKITVHVRVADNFGAIYPQWALADNGTASYDDDVSLGENKSIEGLLNVMDFDSTPETELNDAGAIKPCVMVYINGILAVSRDGTGYTWKGQLINGLGVSNERIKSVQLHDGDEVVIARVQAPCYTYYIDTIPNAPYTCYYPYAALLHIENENVIEVEAGAEFSVSVTKSNGAAEGTAAGFPQKAGNVTLFLSDVQDTRDAALKADTPNSTGVVTNSDGTASHSIYAEGWYKLFVADVRESQNATSSQGTDITGGSFPNLAVGDYILIHVTESTNPQIIRASLQAELDAVYNQYDAEFYGEQWETIQNTYNNAAAIISGKVEEKASLGDAAEAKESAIAAITEIVSAIEIENISKVKTVSCMLELLPSVDEIEAGKFTKGYAARYVYMQERYEEMTEYQKAQLTTAQAQQYEALKKAWEESENGENLPPAVRSAITVKAAGNTECQDKFYLGVSRSFLIGRTFTGFTVIDGDIAYYSNSTYDEAEYTFSNPIKHTAFLLTEFNIDSYTVPAGGTYQLTVGTKLVNAREYEVYKVEIEGADGQVSIYETPQEGDLKSNAPICTDESNTYSYYREAYISIDKVPDNNVTITLYLRSINDEKSFDEEKELAKAELQAHLQTFAKSDYTTEDWAELNQKCNEGLAAIDAAVDKEAVETEKNKAINAMNSIQTRAQKDLTEEEGKLGKVHIVVENTTYSGAPAAIKGVFVDEYVPLNENSTMMSCVYEALNKNGYTWEGTGGSTSDGKDITYISKIIAEDGSSLGEFDGSSQSGWMGTLNDWFTNESFASFSAGASKRDYRIVDGDEIRIMFTLNGYGTDLGGSWDNPDTSLKSLVVSGGILSPAFGGSKTEYVLTLNNGASSISVTPTAVNKNYLVKTFLNKKETANNVDYYRRGESIPVKAGDTVYIGCGQYSWPSMNNQTDDAISYTGTWYTITVTDASDSSSVEKLINALPIITYGNYKVQKTAVESARAAYDALSEEAKENVSAETRKKLIDAEAQILKFEEIDHVKELLAAIPSEDKLTAASKSAVQAAKNAYDRLTAEQRGYITVADTEKYNAAVKWLESQGIETGGLIEKTEDELAAETVIDLINAIGTVTADSQDAITKAREAYDKLTAEQKKLVVNYSALTAAEEELKALLNETGDEEAGKARIIEGVQNTKISIWSASMGAQSRGRGWIRIWYRKSAGYKVDYYEVWRSKGDKKHFGTSAFYTTKKNGLTGWYRNTKSVKKGVRYYYKVRGVRIIDGQKYYTQWSKTIYRTGI